MSLVTSICGDYRAVCDRFLLYALTYPHETQKFNVVKKGNFMYSLRIIRDEKVHDCDYSILMYISEDKHDSGMPIIFTAIQKGLDGGGLIYHLGMSVGDEVLEVIKDLSTILACKLNDVGKYPAEFWLQPDDGFSEKSIEILETYPELKNLVEDRIIA